MEFRVLGTLDVLDDMGATVEVRGSKLRTLLATLLLRAGQPVSADALADALWGDAPPIGVDNALQAQVSKLRKLLADVPLRTHGRGYVLDVDESAIDARRFAVLATDGAQLLDAADADGAAAKLREALGLWRGDAFADFVDEEFAQSERIRLDELRISTLETCVEAELATGRDVDLVPELEALALAHPLRERIWEHLMAALYRAGRQADALRAFQRARAVLADELGLEPGPALRALERRVLEHDPTLDAAPRPAGRGSATPRLSNIHPELSMFVGRKVERAELESIVVARRLVTITGAGGVGKTRIAIEVALATEHRWQDGTWLVDLGSEVGHGAVARALFRTFGPRLGQAVVEEEAGWLERGLAQTTALIVVDNCEHVIDEAASLLATLIRTCPGIHVLATSREPLNVAGEVVRRLPPLNLEDAVALFATRAADSSEDFVLDAGSAPIVEDICEQVDRVPLAIELTAARTRAFTTSQLAELLGNRSRVIAADRSSRPPRQQTLHAAVEWSYDLLFEDERRLLARLSVFFGGFTLDAAAAICADELLPAEDVELVLARLVDKSLVTPDARDPSRRRFRLLRPVAEFAALKLADAGEDASMRANLVRWVTERSDGLTTGLRGPDMLTWARWANDELHNVMHAAHWCRAHGDPVDGLRIAVNFGWYAFLSANMQADEPILVDLIERATGAPPELRCRALMWAAILSIGRTGRRTWAMDAIDVARTAVGSTVSSTDPSTGARSAARHVAIDGVALTNQAIALARDIDDDRLLLEALTIGSLHLGAIGTLPETIDAINDEARALANALDDRWSIAFVTALEGMSRYVAGELDISMELLASAIASLRALGDDGSTGLFEISFSEVAELAGDIDGATRAMTAAVQVGDTAGFGSATILRAVLCWLAGRNGEIDRALALGQEVVDRSRQPFNPVIRAQALFALGVAEHLAGDDDAANGHLGEALAIHDEVGMVRESAMDHRHLGEVCRARGDVSAAVVHGRRSIELAAEVGLPWTIMLCARTLACSLADVGEVSEMETACRLAGIAAGVTTTYHYANTPSERREVDHVIGAATTMLDVARVDELIAFGSSTSFSEITRLIR